MTINERIEFLENTINTLAAKLAAVSSNTEGASKTNYSIVGASRDHNINKPIIWNNTEINAVLGTQPAIPDTARDKHSHSRFSGGALINGVVEVVELDWGIETNKHSQSYKDFPIVKVANTAGESVDKIGLLPLTFNADSGTWGCATFEIDIKKCVFVERETSGVNKGLIKNDTLGNPMSSPLYNVDTTKSSIIWDEKSACWRLYASYAPTPTP